MKALDVLPCALCNEDAPIGALACPECGGNPDAREVPCERCTEGQIEIYETEWTSRPATCPDCHGAETVDPPHIGERIEAKAALAMTLKSEEVHGYIRIRTAQLDFLRRALKRCGYELVARENFREGCDARA